MTTKSSKKPVKKVTPEKSGKTAKAKVEAKPKEKPASPLKTKATKTVVPPASVVEKPSVMAARPEAASPPKKTKKTKDILDAVEKLSDMAAKWSALYERAKNQKPVPYSMAGSYEPRTPLVHKVLGWGYVLTSQNNRLEVLFQDGIKVLISNYKG